MDANAHIRGYYTEASCDLAEFEALTGQTLDPSELRFAAEVVKNVPVYDVAGLGDVLADPARRRALMAEWAWVLDASAGVVALKGAYGDTAVIDEATAIYEAIIAEEKAGTGGGGDHFAKAGANDRVWNSLQKLCLRDPGVFARYFGNPAIAAVCEAWLGPGYQMTAQVNLVRPGGAAQVAHRDYHLGFMSPGAAERFPILAHHLSPALTLQGAVAHCDMPVESGPTKLLPFSQAYGPGYVACQLPAFREHFERAHIQLPLAKGDAVFFNPALFHAAGENRTPDIHRMANLLQVSSPMGRATEAVDRRAMSACLYPALQALRAAGTLDAAEASAAVAACAEGYSFPTNLDSDPPVGGLSPETQSQLFHRALDAAWSVAQFETELAAMAERQTP